ncbi:Lif1p SKDI_07G1680 [Saccharomyces kudriavzevii IFO 1802]|uniref:Uncharacterized protein n=2 Tax=Saccharomyces kudriavzevii (strain ATCC MYA-4449 / AS 2.2408 / CBS 8840 / NBRC 1802 / NCYC 2889) TaxID=226230 RepID=A0AA35JHM8_SACK1|nr:uncharacterized protein SKDI_07G1680 [Saccharomyces kudriavzevii IFO 1802]EJT42424.1 LIF1-like protein [Saccharomyces kudriavzevii IFO 1802]CAI4061758.1 hypothetical protein SKDI_07G1680 [Saccharomyces kudriavzevii IFO 1802]
MKMEFISCIPMANEEAQSRESDERGLCKVRIEDNITLETLNDSNLMGLRIKSLLISEGTVIFSKSSFGINDVRIFTGENIDERSRKHVWYELLRMLTGHKVYVAALEDRIVFSKWTCRMQDNEVWKVVMELESSAIVRKIAELTLYPVSEGEIDLFEMADKLYRDVCRVNDSYRKMRESDSNNRSRVEELAQERVFLDNLLEERDKRTRAMVVILLNEKKKKIKELHEILRRNNVKISDDDIPDSDLINVEVTKPVSELNSPGKRLKRRRSLESRNLKEKLKNADGHRVGTKEPNKSAIKKEDDDFDDFQFFGLSKRTRTADNDKLSENEDDSIAFGNDTRSISSLSDNGNNINEERLVYLEQNDVRSPVDKIGEDKGLISRSESETDTNAEDQKKSNYSELLSNDKESTSGRESETDIETDSS